jgi:hypothetical protein
MSMAFSGREGLGRQLCQVESGLEKGSRAKFGHSKPGCPKVLAGKSGDLILRTLASQVNTSFP